MKKQYLSLAVAAMLTLGAAGLANASNAISYSAFNLSDVNMGEDLWRYTYTVTGDSFADGTGFAIDFEKSLFVLPEGQQTAPNSDWDVWTSTSSYDPEIAVYDAYALFDNASLADSFSVDFVWTGEAAGPGAQYFVVYDRNNGAVLQNGTTSPVPVPAAVWLLGSGLATLAGSRLRKRN
jgi:hypothetical protein